MIYPTTRIKSVVLILGAALLITACGGGGGSGNKVEPPPPPNQADWLLSLGFIFDGGPGKDGIPALNAPQFESAQTIRTVNANDFAIAIRHEGAVKIYPHDILDWHEIVNDGPDDNPYTLSYCPLTGSALAWRSTASDPDATFGVSGLLFNSNLLLYDRSTDSVWSQMYEQSVFGSRIAELPERMQLIEAKFGTLKEMFPDAMVLTRATGHARDYHSYPYGNYRENSGILFPPSNTDQRLHTKTRVIGIRDGEGVDELSASKVYQLAEFGSTTQVINEQFGNLAIVVVGNSELSFAVIYDRTLADGTILNFSPVADDLPNIMTDTEDNVWDAFGTAVSGPRSGQQLASTRSFTAYWFAWIAHFENAEIHFN